MKIIPNSITVGDFCDAIDRGEIVVNRAYQRSHRVWPDVARSYLIETILLDFPIPKLWLNQVTDLKTRRSVKEVVDGQQRTFALHDFANNKFPLSNRVVIDGAAGKRYDTLPEDLQGAFLNYALSFDLFVGATPEEVREVFRRINSYTIPLNPEEQRHAVFQGAFKWFINRLSRDYSEPLHGMGVFTETQLVRMADAKLLTEVVHALFNGITTTDKNKLDALYESRDHDFPEEQETDRVLTAGLDQLIAWDDLHETSLMKPLSVYSLLLAVIHLRIGIDTLDPVYHRGKHRIRRGRTPLVNLLHLADALDDPDSAEDRLEPFIEASSSQTNTRAQRETRFTWYCRALADDFQ